MGLREEEVEKVYSTTVMAYKEKANAIRYNNEFIKQAYDRINLTVPKGQKEVIQAAAEKRGESVNGFINRAISETIDRDAAQEANQEGA